MGLVANRTAAILFGLAINHGLATRAMVWLWAPQRA